MGYNNSRIQIVDRTGRVLLTAGDIQSATGIQLASVVEGEKVNKYWLFLQNKVLDPLYYQILTKPSNDFIDELYSEVTREGAHISSALRGAPNPVPQSVRLSDQAAGGGSSDYGKQ